MVLIDDIASELDEKNKTLLLSELARLKTQSFITSVELFKVKKSPLGDVFHVEHGELTP